ncbi:MAG: HAD family hydrolase [Candidatus Nanohaloarchaea archaeon]|nr:HAD family hydrolase [Candidatus Nanohaloarchaea archaeon]
MLERAGAEPTERLVEEAYDLFWDTVLEDLVFEEGLPGMLERLDRKFEILAIATDELPGALEMKLSTVFHEPEEIFDDFVTPKEVDEMKPSESFYRKILENHGIEPGEAVMVGDSWERDLEPAQDLGMVTVLVGGSGEGGPDHRIETITDLEEVLEEIR